MKKRPYSRKRITRAASRVLINQIPLEELQKLKEEFNRFEASKPNTKK